MKARLASLLFCLGAALASPAPGSCAVLTATSIAGNEEWSGSVTLKAPVVVEKTGSLKILPGTSVRMEVGDSHRLTPWIYVEGEIRAAGEPGRMIEFSTGSSGPGLETQDAISILAARVALFENVSFTGCGWAIHLHETPCARVSGCVFKGNYGGVRFKSDGFTLTGNLFEENRIGVRGINSLGPILRDNRFSGNLTGVFFREGIREPVLQGNTFDDTEYDVKLGEGQVSDVDARGNAWVRRAGTPLADRIFDGADSEGVGRVIVEEEK